MTDLSAKEEGVCMEIDVKENEMRICVPVENNEGKNSRVCAHFGSSPYFALCDVSQESIEIIDNAQRVHEHGKCVPVRLLADRGVDMVLCRGMGMRAIMNLSGMGIKAHRFAEKTETLGDALEALKSGGTEEMTERAACQHHGHGCR